MKASKFVGFFDFTVTREDHVDKDGYCSRFYVTDNHGCFESRENMYIDGLAHDFNACFEDYIDAPLKEAGFIYDSSRRKSYYSQALEFLKGKTEHKELYDVINCILHPEKIKDDISPKGKDALFIDPKVFLKSFFIRTPENVVKAIEEKENMSIDDVIETISVLDKFRIIGNGFTNDYYSLLMDLQNHTQCLEETVDTFHDLTVKAKEQKEAA